MERGRRVVLALLLLTFGSLALPTCSAIAPRHGWDERWGPLVPHETFPADCSICHLPDRWDKLKEDFRFDHEKETGHALKGAHEKAACLRCHNDFGPVQLYSSRGCVGCHVDPHNDQLGARCTQCHDEKSWRPGGLIAEHARTRFPLIGVHAAVSCELCHRRAPARDFKGAPTQCEICHAAALAQAQSPDHAAMGWVRNCERCHRPTTWAGAGFVHDFFPLIGGHALAACTDCHTGGTFAKLPTACLSCHQDDRNRAPGHDAFPVTCESCHNTTTWKGAVFGHAFFPLTGRHAAIACTDCHTGGTFTKLPTTCISCHQDDRTRAPNHGGFPTTCQDCHNTTTWKGAVFNHRFPLRGKHNVDCNVCHVGGNTQTFSCTVCHTRNETDKDHDEVANYRYESAACFQCHPDGKD